jgi:hypothetical protein
VSNGNDVMALRSRLLRTAGAAEFAIHDARDLALQCAIEMVVYFSHPGAGLL